MTFSTITADPTWGTLVDNTPPAVPAPLPAPSPTFNGDSTAIADLGAVVNLAAINTSGITKPTAGWITYNGIGGEVFFRDSYINSDATAATSWTGTVPTVAEGDLMVAVLMHRQSGGALTLPTGWTQQGPDYLSGITFGGDVQLLTVCTKVAAASEPATVTWTLASSARFCGFLVSLVGNDFTMGTALESYGNADTASIVNGGADFYITAATWVYSANTDPEPYSQTGTGVTEISDSPQTQARISGGYSSSNGTVTSFHGSVDVVNSPNHGIISIPFTVAGGNDGGGGGSTRPTSGMLYPRGQG